MITFIGNDSDVSEGDVSEPGSVERSPLPSMDISLPAASTEFSNLSSSMEDSDLQSLIGFETCRGRVKVRGQRGGSKRGRGRGRKWKEGEEDREVEVVEDEVVLEVAVVKALVGPLVIYLLVP